MEAANDALKLIASSLEILKDKPNFSEEKLDHITALLEQAVDKLAR